MLYAIAMGQIMKYAGDSQLIEAYDAKNCQNRMRFDKDIAKIKCCSF